MTGTDLIVLAPWIAFVVGLAVICLVLLRSRRASRPRRSPRPVPGAAGTAGAAGAAGVPADRERADGPDQRETRCPEKNAKARPQ
jgi:hypothetical protein